MYTTFLTCLHVLVSILTIFVVLLHHGKGADLGASFGSSHSVFGSKGASSFLFKLTLFLFLVLLFTSLSLNYFSILSQDS